MSTKIVTEPQELPVTLAQALDQLREVPAPLHAQVQSLLYAATENAEGFLGRALIEQTWELVLECFPGREIELPKPPLQSVTSVKYLDVAAVEQTASAGLYQVDTVSTPGRIKLLPTASWPETAERLNAVTIRFVAGYGGAAKVPFQIKAGILLHAEAHFDRDERQMAQLIAAAESLWWPFRLVRL